MMDGVIPVAPREMKEGLLEGESKSGKGLVCVSCGGLFQRCWFLGTSRDRLGRSVSVSVSVSGSGRLFVVIYWCS